MKLMLLMLPPDLGRSKVPNVLALEAAVTLSNFSEGTFGKLCLSDAFAALKESLAPIKAGRPERR